MIVSPSMLVVTGIDDRRILIAANLIQHISEDPLGTILVTEHTAFQVKDSFDAVVERYACAMAYL